MSQTERDDGSKSLVLSPEINLATSEQILGYIKREALGIAYKKEGFINRRSVNLAYEIAIVAFNNGVSGQAIPENGDLKKFTVDAIKAGLKQREEVIKKGARVVTEMNSPRPNFQFKGFVLQNKSYLAVPNELVGQANEELFNKDKTIFFESTQKLINLVETRKRALDVAIFAVLETTTGLNRDDEEFVKLMDRLPTLREQSMIVKGFMCSLLLKMAGSHAEYDSFFLSDEALVDLADFLENRDMTPLEQQELVTSLVASLKIPSEAQEGCGDLFEAYLGQIWFFHRNWKKIEERRGDRGKYMMILRKYFGALPIDPEFANRYFKTDYIFSDLWKDAIVVGNHKIPSKEGLHDAKAVLSLMTDHWQALRMAARLGRAIAAWNKHDRDKKIPDWIERDEERLVLLRQKLESYEANKEKHLERPLLMIKKRKLRSSMRHAIDSNEKGRLQEEILALDNEIDKLMTKQQVRALILNIRSAENRVKSFRKEFEETDLNLIKEMRNCDFALQIEDDRGPKTNS